MYTRLTKVVKHSDGKESVACINFDTERCLIHNGFPDCSHCPVFAAIINQLCAFEDIVETP
jgi:hypothetical protein